MLGCTRSWGRCWAARLFHRSETSGRAVHEEVDGLNIGGQHGRRFVLLRHTHRPQRRPYPIYTSRSGNVRQRCGGGWAGPRLFLGESFREGGCLWWKYGVLQGCPPTPHSIGDPSAHCAARMLLLSDKLMSCCVTGTNACLDSRRRATTLDGRVSAEWSRCPGSMARRPRDVHGEWTFDACSFLFERQQEWAEHKRPLSYETRFAD